MIEKGKIYVTAKDCFIGETIIKIVEECRIGPVCSLITEGIRLLEIIEASKPNLVILDLFLNDISGLSILEELSRRNIHLNILCYCRCLNKNTAVKAVKLGASGIIDLSCSASDFHDAVIATNSFKHYIPADILRIIDERDYELNSMKYKALTARQNQVLEKIACGSSCEEISYSMHISSKTVEKHRKNIKEKLGLKSSFELCSFALREGYLEYKEDGDVFKLQNYRA